MAPSSVLLVDQDPDSLAMYSLVLEHHGYRVLRATCGDAGFELACEARPDVVVTEIYLSGRSELSLAERLKGDPRTADLPILAVTSVPVHAGTAARAVAVCDRYLMKPCVPSRLLREVRELTERAGRLVSDSV